MADPARGGLRVTPDYVIFMDGGCTANPGQLAVAAVVCTPDFQVVTQLARSAGEGTNNVAEYRALRHAIAMANLVGAREPLFLSDSKLVVEQVNGWWAIKEPGLHMLHGWCTGALMNFDRWLVKHVPREKNKRADYLVSKHLGHARTLKRPPSVAKVDCEHAGWAGWSQMDASGRR
jgi:ribonuclease HI